MHLLVSSLFPTELVCMLVRTMHEVREDMGPLVAMVMCSVPSDEPFTLIVQTSDGTAIGEQMNEMSQGLQCVGPSVPFISLKNSCFRPSIVPCLNCTLQSLTEFSIGKAKSMCHIHILHWNLPEAPHSTYYFNDNLCLFL